MKPHKRLLLGSLAVALVGAVSSAPAHAAAKKADPKIALEAAALSDDILAVLDLPLVVHAAVHAGVPAADVEAVLASTADAGLSAGEAAMVLEAEVRRTRDEGPRPGLGTWVRAQVAEGATGKVLAERIELRKPDKPAKPDVEAKKAAKIDAKLKALHAARKAEREAIRVKRKELVASGKAVSFAWKEEHARLVDTLKAEGSSRGREKQKLDRVKAVPVGSGKSSSVAREHAATDLSASPKAKGKGKKGNEGKKGNKGKSSKLKADR